MINFRIEESISVYRCSSCLVHVHAIILIYIDIFIFYIYVIFYYYYCIILVRVSRTLLASVDEETNIDSEPWPIKLAKYSIQWTVQLINNSHSTLTSQSYITEKI